MKKSLLKKILAMFLTFTLVFGIMGAGAEDTLGNSDHSESKICPNLLEMMNSSGRNDLIPVWIFRDAVCLNNISALVYAETGKNPDIYEHPEVFETYVNFSTMQILGIDVPRDFRGDFLFDRQIANTVQEHFSEFEVSRSSLNRISFSDLTLNSDTTISGSNEIFSEEIQDVVRNATAELADSFTAQRADILRREVANSNRQFRRNIPVSRDVIYEAKYTGTFVIRATPAEIRRYALLSDVESISYYDVNAVAEPLWLNHAVRQTGAHTMQNLGFRGNGINVGVLEPRSATLAENSNRIVTTAANRHRHLRGASITYVQNGDASISEPTTTAAINSANLNHATQMTALIVGQPVTVDGNSLEGVVPEANVFFANFNACKSAYSFSVSCMFRGLEALASRGVHVISCSFRLVYSDNLNTYSQGDREMDRFIVNRRIPVVVAAGNAVSNDPSFPTPLEIRSPARAINAITVGNVGITSGGTNVSPPFTLHSSSAYFHPNFLPNKPDVVAPGEGIRIASPTVNCTPQFSATGGTSAAAAVTAGVVAQILQRVPSFRSAGRHPAVKAFLLMNADPRPTRIVNTFPNDFIANTGLGQADSLTRLHQGRGAGFLRYGTITGGSFHNGILTQTGQTVTTGTISVPANRTLRAALVFEKANTVQYTSSTVAANNRDSMRLQLRNSSGTIVASSINAVQNVHIIEFRNTGSSAATFTLRAVADQISTASANGGGTHFTIVWRVTENGYS